MGRPATTSRSRRSSASRFSRSELEMMEKLLLEVKDNLLDGKIHQKLAAKFNRVPNRAGRKAVKAEHVRQWFAKKRKDNASAVASSLTDQNQCVVVSNSGDLPVVPDASLSNNAPEISSDRPKGNKSPEVVKWEFEAKSSNEAWYDVAAFVSFRIRSGKVEVLVNYQGFGSEEDEWVVVKDAVRRRSIALDCSECMKVKVGDLVLCFRETSDQSAHYEAHVMEIQRKLHDIRGCRCLFWIRYNHDRSEERVQLKRLCVRPPANRNL